MKRILVSAIIAAASINAYAESNVTLYGVIDQAVAVTKHKHIRAICPKRRDLIIRRFPFLRDRLPTLPTRLRPSHINELVAKGVKDTLVKDLLTHETQRLASRTKNNCSVCPTTTSIYTYVAVALATRQFP